MKKILLLNLPYKNKKLQRDFSCPHSSKADYYWPSIDLVVYSAIFSDQELHLIDCIQEKLEEDELVGKIRILKPDYIFTIISAISLEDDLRVMRKIKAENRKIKICASGDMSSFEPAKILKNKEIDFVISDFIERKKIRDIIFNKQKDKIICSSDNSEFEIGIPRHELFKKYAYKLPYSFYQPISSLITNYGCPFKCKFCNSNNLRFRSRKLSEVIEDMRYIKESGVREIYIRDFTFGIPRIKELLNAIVKEKLDLKWSCEFRVDLVNKEILNLMKKAGCFLIFYGGESGNQKTLDLMNKGFGLRQIRNAINLTKKTGIETLISFIIGFESESKKEVLETKRFIMEINPDYLSINILVPRIGSEFRKEIESGEIEKLDTSEEAGKRYPDGKFALDYKKNIERAFFFRPSKMMRYFLLSIKTKKRFKNFIQSGISILLRISS